MLISNDYSAKGIDTLFYVQDVKLQSYSPKRRAWIAHLVGRCVCNMEVTIVACSNPTEVKKRVKGDGTNMY